MGDEEQVLFREVQRFRQPWLWGVVMLTAVCTVGVFGYGMVGQLLLGRPRG